MFAYTFQMQSQGDNFSQTIVNPDATHAQAHSSASSTNSAQQQPQVVQLIVNIHGNVQHALFGDSNEMTRLTRAESVRAQICTIYLDLTFVIWYY